MASLRTAPNPGALPRAATSLDSKQVADLLRPMAPLKMVADRVALLKMAINPASKEAAGPQLVVK